ncbi:MAG: hypothetical protein K1X63_13490 [Chitinophagales bacterium]|nr:hypothetical protein [Chitinophagales bacterium]
MKKKKKEDVAETHPDLKGLRMSVDQFGRLNTSVSLERINDFLDKHVIDKKLNEEEWEENKKKTGKTPSPSKPNKRKKK